jgi:hypothetical protein
MMNVTKRKKVHKLVGEIGGSDENVEKKNKTGKEIDPLAGTRKQLKTEKTLEENARFILAH